MISYEIRKLKKIFEGFRIPPIYINFNISTHIIATIKISFHWFHESIWKKTTLQGKEKQKKNDS